MFTFRWMITLSLLLVSFQAASEPASKVNQVPAKVEPANRAAPKLGQHLKRQEVRSITVWPNGKGLPAGSGTIATGRALYSQHCLACHGQEGKNGINAALVGGQVAPNQLPKLRTPGSYWPYATSLFDYIRRAMPYQEPGSLTNNQVYSLVAYLLFLNDVITEDVVLDATQLSKVTLPNRQRFYSEYEIP